MTKRKHLRSGQTVTEVIVGFSLLGFIALLSIKGYSAFEKNNGEINARLAKASFINNELQLLNDPEYLRAQFFNNGNNSFETCINQGVGCPKKWDQPVRLKTKTVEGTQIDSPFSFRGIDDKMIALYWDNHYVMYLSRYAFLVENLKLFSHKCSYETAIISLNARSGHFQCGRILQNKTHLKQGGD